MGGGWVCSWDRTEGDEKWEVEGHGQPTWRCHSKRHAGRSAQQPRMWSWSGRAGEKRKEKTKLIEELKKELKDARRQNNVNVQIVEDLTAAVEEQAQEIAKLREKGNMQEVKMKILVDMWAMRFLDEQHEKNRGCLQK